MGLKSLFLGHKSSTSSTSTSGSVRGNPRLKAHAYDSAVALEAPVRGSYPVAGNGPNLLDELQRARARKDAVRKAATLSRTSSTHNRGAAAPADIARSRGNTLGRVGIDNGKTDSGQDSGYGASPSDGRTRSGFTTRSPPIFSNATRRSSLDSPSRKAIPPLPLFTVRPAFREIKTYQPTTATDDHRRFTTSTPPFSRRQRSDSPSHKSHVDLLEAHSQIRSSQESIQHRTKASGSGNYGEDVADRNIKDYGSHRVVKNKRASRKALDAHVSESSYFERIHTRNDASTKCKGAETSIGASSFRKHSGTRPVVSSSTSPMCLRVGSVQPRNHALSGDDIVSPVPSKPASKPSLRSRTTAESSRSRLGTTFSAPGTVFARTASASKASPATFVAGPLRSRPFISTAARSDTSSTRSCPFDMVDAVDAADMVALADIVDTSSTSSGRDDRSFSPNDAYDRSARALSPLSDSSGSGYYHDPEVEGPAPPIPDWGRSRLAREFLPPSVTARLPPSATARLSSPVRISNPVPVSIVSSSSSPSSSSPPSSSSTSRPSHRLEARNPVQLAPVLTARSTNSKVRPAARKRASVSFSDDPPQSILPAKYPPPSSRDRRRIMSTEMANGHPLAHRTAKSGPMSNSPYPNGGSVNHHADSTSRQSAVPRRKGMLVENSKGPISLEGIVDISNTVDATVTTKKLPAVVHEHITPTQHTIREEAITREIHHHDVYHRILPVIETIILPTKHFIYAPDRTFLIEIPERDVLQYTGRPLESINQGWKLVRITEPTSPVTPAAAEKVRKPSVARKSNPGSNTEQFLDQFQSLGPYIHRGNHESSESSAPRVEAPDESLSRHEQLSTAFSQITGNSPTQGRNPGPALTSKRTYMTKEGFPRTEYFWRHPPVFEDGSGRTQPIYMRNVIGGARLNSDFRSSSDEEDMSGDNYGAANPEGEMFCDSGYGEYTALPGLPQNADPVSPVNGRSVGHSKNGSTIAPLPGQTPPVKSILKTSQSPLGTHTPPSHSPLAPHFGTGQGMVDDEPGDKIQLGSVLDDEHQPRSTGEGKTGEATNFLRRLKEKRLSGDSNIFKSWSKAKGRQSADLGRG